MKFDVVVVGAGCSGSVAALNSAKKGYKTLLVERGPEPGSKNVSGAMIRESDISRFVDIDGLPFEKVVKSVKLVFSTKANSVELRIRPRDKLYTVSRLKFDKWLAQKAEQAGALLVTKTTVTGVEGNKVITERGGVEADYVILSEGANALLSMSLGMRRELKPEEAVLGLKEVYSMTRDEVNKRFGLQGDDGEAWRVISDNPIPFAGFVYTYKDSVSLGVGVPLSNVKGLKPYEVLDSFRSSLSELVKGSSLREYSAKVIPENGFPSFKACNQRVYVTGDAIGLVDPLTFNGIGPAIASGYLASENLGQCEGYERALLQEEEVSRIVRSRTLVKELLKEENFKFYVNLIVDLFEGWSSGDLSKLKYYKSNLWAMLRHLTLGLGVVG
ncbi:NAD(P)/FAD-dependent oxidoreductase [Stygiolobus caldivivus]|uniref:FAD-dependent oxidoreductase n=1 Tax=Stygiolobus caldivivus TaxID=2824673 RepID=A0A8D5ZHN7_9CREN|nr:NAD(P)/FAD-dependent oxidoreductase [Stygiolobus caldivivus]BCU69869.1 FAD-dependent oxidoreductase [Stygiolobus caldivivus]